MKRKTIKRLTAVAVIVAILSGISATSVSAAAYKKKAEETQTIEARITDSNEQVMSRQANHSYPQVNLYINQRKVQEKSYLINDTTYVPLRAICESLDECEIGWSSGVATVKSDNLTMRVQQNTNYIEANERILYHSSPTLNIDSRIYVPVRSVAKAYSLDVKWDGSTRSVYLSGDPKALKRGKDFYNENDLYWLSRIIHAESNGEPLLGKIAVGNVIVNRKNRSDYPNSIYGVIFDKKYGTQFSPVAYGTIHNTPNADSVKAAKIVLEGYSLNDQMIFFINPKLATNFWITQKRTFVMRIGNHSFYK